MPDRIRVLELPACRMACSGYAREAEPFAPGGTLRRFEDWWTQADAQRVDRWFARDFMMYEHEEEAMVWYYALADDYAANDCPFDVVQFPGGLYAAAVAPGSGEADEQEAFGSVKEWVRQHAAFALDERPGHYDLHHFITPKRVEQALGRTQLEIYVPIRMKRPPSRP